MQVSLSESCTHLVQATYVARDWGISHAHMTQHTTTNKRQPQHTMITLPPDHGRCPPVKPWGQNDKELLRKLIDRRKIDISRTGDTDYIDRIRQKYFRPRDTLNFRRNFQSYTRSRDLEDHLRGYCREQRGGIILLILLLSFYIASNASLLPPSLNFREQIRLEQRRLERRRRLKQQGRGHRHRCRRRGHRRSWRQRRPVSNG